MESSNNNVSLRPTTIHDKRKVFEWLAHSNLTNEMLGKPTFPDNPVPTWDEFDEDYLDYFFDGSQPSKGRCYIILNKDEEAGQINYNPINKKTKTTELDIWLADRRFIGKGIGTSAIKILCKELFDKMGCARIFIQPSSRNQNAVKTYAKAGFEILTTIPRDFELDYYDSVVMELKKSNI